MTETRELTIPTQDPVVNEAGLASLAWQQMFSLMATKVKDLEDRVKVLETP